MPKTYHAVKEALRRTSIFRRLRFLLVACDGLLHVSVNGLVSKAAVPTVQTRQRYHVVKNGTLCSKTVMRHKAPNTREFNMLSAKNKGHGMICLAAV